MFDYYLKDAVSVLFSVIVAADAACAAVSTAKTDDLSRINEFYFLCCSDFK